MTLDKKMDDMTIKNTNDKLSFLCKDDKRNFESFIKKINTNNKNDHFPKPYKPYAIKSLIDFVECDLFNKSHQINSKMVKKYYDYVFSGNHYKYMTSTAYTKNWKINKALFDVKPNQNNSINGSHKDVFSQMYKMPLMHLKCNFFNLSHNSNGFVTFSFCLNEDYTKKQLFSIVDVILESCDIVIEKCNTPKYIDDSIKRKCSEEEIYKKALSASEAITKESDNNIRYNHLIKVIMRNPYIRLAIVNGANKTCQICQKVIGEDYIINIPRLECHHIKPLSDGGFDILENCIALCPNCHVFEHKKINSKDF